VLVKGRRRASRRRRAARTGRGPAKREELMPHVARFSVPHVDVPSLIFGDIGILRISLLRS
jgi:hypothetical protein